jgi:AcrR family transcriptional regulator
VTTQESPVGRPREFDVEEALEQAMLVFWKQGYEGSSMGDLERAMGISRASLYAAFGKKEQLFRKALDRYSQGPAAYTARALEKVTAREVATAYLTGAVRATTRPGSPLGCLSVQGALAITDDSRTAHDILITWREEGVALLRERFQRAIDEGDLPPDSDAGQLARYVITVGNGIAVQAAGGTPRSQLQQMADLALKSWPSA